jgi:outer membrane receptor protein involved in Fe transport
MEGDPKETDELRKNMIDSSSVGSFYPVTRQYTAGLNLRSMFGKNGYSILTLYASGAISDVDVREEFAVRRRGSNGEVLSSDIINTVNSFSNHGVESFVGLKYDLFYRLHPAHELSVGGQIQTASLWKNDVYVAPDSSRFDLNRDGVFETGPIVFPGWVYHDRQSFGDASKYYLYASDRMEITPRLFLTLGVRYDHFTYSGQGSFSPRASLVYQIVPSLTSLTFSLGRYYQTHPFPFYGDGRQLGYNKNLANMLADHYVAGFEHILDRGLKLSIEGYFKK